MKNMIMSFMRMPCSKNNNNTHHTRHAHTHTHTYWLPPRWLSYLARFIFGNVFHDFVLDFIGSSCLVRPALAAGEKEELCCCFPSLRPFSLSRALSMSLLSQPVRCHMFALLSPVRSVSPVTTLTVILTITMRAITAAKPLTYKVTMLLAAPTSP